MKPVVSIVVPVYNCEKWVEACLSSILSQTYDRFEVLVVDDGSKDRSGEVCDRMATMDGRIKVFHQDNGGVNSARRKGVENSCGEWLVFVDADDRLPADSLELYSGFFDSGSDILIQGAENVSIDRDEYLQLLLKGDISPALWAKAFKSDFYKAHCPVLGREMVMGEDLLINLVVGMNISSARYVAGHLYDVNESNTDSVTKIFKRTWNYEKHYFHVLENLFLDKSEDMECYEQLELLVRKSQLNGMKYVMLSGNDIDYNDSEFKRTRDFFIGRRQELGLSERLIFIIRNSSIYRMVMNAVIASRKLGK